MAVAERAGEMRTPEQLLAEVREYALSNILWPLLATGGLIAFVSTFQRWLYGNYALLAVYLLLYMAVLAATLARAASYRARVYVLLAVLGALSVMEVRSYGNTSLLGITLMALVIFAGVFMGRWAGYVMLAATTALEVAAAALYLHGYIPIEQASQQNALDPAMWTTFISTFGFLGAGVMLSCVHIIERVVTLAQGSRELVQAQEDQGRRRAELEKQLREREARYESFLKTTSDGVWCYEFSPPMPVDLPVEEQVKRCFDARLVECNEHCAIAYGVSGADAALGRPFRDFVGEPADAVEGLLRRFVEQGYRTNREELLLRSSKGGTRYFEVTASGVVEDACLLRIWGSFREVTEMRVAARQRQTAQDRFTSLVRNIPGCMYLAHRVGGDSKMLFLSEGIEAITGRTAAQTIQMAPGEVAEVIHPEDRQRVYAAVDAAYATKQPYTHEYRVVSPSGEVRWVLDRGQTRTREGIEGIFAEGVLVDVTARHEAEDRLRRQEEQLRQAQKMEAIGQLAGGIAHDFNNILQGILGFADVALQSKDLPPKQADLFRHISRSAERAAALVRQLLMFSRRMEAEPEYLDMADQVRRTSELLRRILGAQVELVLNIPESTCCVYADASQIEQVVINLAVNARDAMPQGGTLTIEVSPAHMTEERARQLGLARHGDYIRLSVADTGDGMDPQTLAHIFEPFFTTKALGKGTGLGLATVYGIVQRYSGWIEARSEPGYGSTFEILLPRESVVPGSQVEGPPVESEEDTSATVLLAEDDALVRTATTQMLASAGYHVIAVANGKEGIEAYDRDPKAINIAVLDVVMPEMGGVELLEALRARDPGLPVLLLTGYAEVNAGAGAAPVAMLQKPVRAKQLLDAIQRLLHRAHQTREVS